MNFTTQPTEVAHGRRFVASALRGCPDVTVDQAVLLTSELVSNAIIHASSDGQLTVQVADGHLRVEVTDHSAVVPTKRAHGPQDIHGRGLEIVDAVADQWGVDLLASGKRVWATLEERRIVPEDVSAGNQFGPIGPGLVTRRQRRETSR